MIPPAAYLVLPLSRAGVPRWQSVVRMFGLHRDEPWRNVGLQRVRGQLHGHVMRVDPANWSERHTFLRGRFYDLRTQKFLLGVTRDGDTAIDIGANIGMMTLLLSRCVGERGQVIAFEPNPDAASRITDAIEENGISNVILHRVAAGDSHGNADLAVISDHTGMGTLTEPDADERDLVSCTHKVEVDRVDSRVEIESSCPVTIKIDVEGFEFRALHGMERILTGDHVTLVVECIERHLVRAGSNVRAVFDLFHQFGFETYAVASSRVGLVTHWRLDPIGADDHRITTEKVTNIVAMRPESLHAQRLEDRGFTITSR